MSTQDDSETVSEFDPPTGEFGDVEPDESGELSDDAIFGLLKNQRRRDALRFLNEHGGTSTLSELAEHIAAKENDIEVRQLSSDQRKRVYIGLYQCHLPKMDSAGVIDFDKNRGDVELCEPADQLLPYVKGTEVDGPDAEPGDTEADESNDGPTREAKGDGGVVQQRSSTDGPGLSDVACGVITLVVAGGLAGLPGVRRLPDSWLAGAAAGGWLASRFGDRE